MKISVVVLISGNGSNLQALIDAQKKYDLKYNIVAVISNKEDAFGLERARKANIKTEVVASKLIPSREDYDKQLIACIEKYAPDLIVLAGFMRILTENFIHRFENKILNIHPSLLPLYPGLKTHEQVITNKDQTHGCTIHFVTKDLDAGPIIAQASLNVTTHDTAASIQKSVLRLEHLLYPLVIQWFAENCFQLTNTGVQFNEKNILLNKKQFNEETLQKFYQQILPPFDH